MEPSTYNAIEEAAQEGARVVKEVLAGGATDEAALARARIGSSAMSTLGKLYQANSAREAVVVSIITHAATDAAEFRRLVQAALPGSAVTKALTEHSEA